VKDFIKAAIAVTCVVFGARGVSAQQPGTATVTQGSCNLSVINMGAGAQTVQLQSGICSDDVDPSKALRIRYVWLDAASASLLIAGKVSGNLAKSVGGNPHVLETKVYAELVQLVNRFGSSLPDYRATTLGAAVSNGQNAILTQQPMPDVTRSLGGHVKIYTAQEDVLFPDVNAYLAIQNSNGFPSDYSMFYMGGVSADESASDLLSRVVLWRAVTDKDLTNYASNVAKLENMVVGKKTLPVAAGAFPINASQAPAARVANRTVAAMQYFARASWPSDFLFVTATGDSCAPDTGGLLKLSPRELFVQVAVIDNVEGKGVMQISAVHGSEIVSDALRLSTDDKTWSPFSMSFPVGVLESNESLVIPLQMELRQNENLRDLTTAVSKQDEVQFFNQIRSYHKPVVLKDNGKVLFKKTLDAFKEPTMVPESQAYTYGPRIQLSSVVSKGKELTLRQFDPYSVSTQFGYEEGSCPEIAFQEPNDATPLPFGRVLVGASGESRSQTDVRWHKGPASFLELEEDEPEITHVQSIRTYVVDAAGKESLVDFETNKILAPGVPLRIRNDEMRHATEIKVEIRGFYDSLPTLLLKTGLADQKQQ
jgi:hypothetical protein